jgi:hypothetical protein
MTNDDSIADAWKEAYESALEMAENQAELDEEQVKALNYLKDMNAAEVKSDRKAHEKLNLLLEGQEDTVTGQEEIKILLQDIKEEQEKPPLGLTRRRLLAVAGAGTVWAAYSGYQNTQAQSPEIIQRPTEELEYINEISDDNQAENYVDQLIAEFDLKSLDSEDFGQYDDLDVGFNDSRNAVDILNEEDPSYRIIFGEESYLDAKNL